MRLVIFAALIAACSADLLTLRQKAPHSAHSAGGGDFLSSPTKPSYNYNPPQNNYIPPQNNYLPPQNNYLPPQNNYLPPQQTSPKPQYIPPATTAKPVTQYLPPQNSYGPPAKPMNNYLPPQNNYLPPSGPTTPPVPILKQTNELNEDGSFKYEYLSGDQTNVEAMGHIENPGTDHEEQVMHGSYSYIGTDGVTYKITYVADANGFRAFGDHLPTPPPIPPEIQQALDKNAAEEANQNNGYPSGPSQGYPSGPSQGYPSGPSQGYPSQKPQPSYLPPSQPSYNPQTGYHY